VRELQSWPTVHKAKDGEEVLPGVTAHIAPGHTPGHLMFVLSGRDREVFVEALLHPPSPSGRMKAAVGRYRKRLGVS